MGRRLFSITLVLLLSTSLTGCISNSSENSSFGDSSIEVPVWNIGQWWMYTFTTPEFGDVTTRLVVTENDTEDGTAYMLGITNQLEAHRHALLNFNPFLGRMTHDNLSVYENGVPQPVFSFPLGKNKQWSFDLLGFEGWAAEVIEIGKDSALITATHIDGGTITYTFSEEIGFMSQFKWIDSDSTDRIEMRWGGVSGTNYDGDAYFVKAVDLWNELYQGNDGTLYDSQFLNNGHPTQGEFDHLYVYLDVEITSTSTSHGSLLLKTHSGVHAKEEIWPGGTSEKGSISVIPSQVEEYALEVSCTGADSKIHLIIVGGIETAWDL